MSLIIDDTPMQKQIIYAKTKKEQEKILHKWKAEGTITNIKYHENCVEFNFEPDINYF